MHSHGGTQATLIEEGVNATYVLSQWLAWKQETSAETEAQMVSRLGQVPSNGRCDALGRLLVDLPGVSSDGVSHLRLLFAPPQKMVQAEEGRNSRLQ